MDRRFEFPGLANAWRSGKKQVLHGTEMAVFDSVPALDSDLHNNPRQLQFLLDSKKPLLFDFMSRFEVQGRFECKGAGADDDWEPALPTDYVRVLVHPNWFEILLRNIDVFHENYVVKTSQEQLYVQYFRNCYLYSVMDPMLKRLLAPEKCHPAYSVPKVAGSWNFDVNGAWHKYCAELFKGNITFTWVPLFVWPFHQAANYMIDAQPSSAVPVNHTGPLNVRMTFADKWDIIFRRAAGNAKTYRFTLNSMKFYAEEARMSPLTDQAMFGSSKKILPYYGVTNLCDIQSITAGVFVFRTKFDKVPMPESVFIFCLPRTVVGATWEFKDVVDPTKVFLPHNIDSHHFSYGGFDFFNKEPNFGQICLDYMELKSLLDHLTTGPFGLMTDISELTRDVVPNGFASGCYPHVYALLSPSGNRTRLVPQQNDGSVLGTNADFEVSLKFGTGGATADATYIIYLSYTDCNLNLDLKDKRFASPYGLR